MTPTKDMLPPHLKHNVIITEFTNHGRKGRIYYPQDGASRGLQKNKRYPPQRKGESTKLAGRASCSPLGHGRAPMTDAIEADILCPHVCA